MDASPSSPRPPPAAPGPAPGPAAPPGLPRRLPRRLPGGLVGEASRGAGLLGVVPLHGGATDLAGRLHGGQGPSGQDAGGSGGGRMV